MELSQLEKETIQTIQKGLDDLRKGLATKDELVKEIDQRVTDDKTAIEQSLTAVRNELDETKTVAETLKGQIRRLRDTDLGGTGGTPYRGRLKSAAEARLIGLQIMAASMAAGLNHPEISRKHARIMKAIEKAGVELIAVEEKTGARLDIEKAATTTGQATGSLLVTTEMAPGLIMLLEQYGKFRANAANVPMGAGSTLTPKLDTLMTLYVPGEGTAPTVSDPTIGAVNLVPKALTGLFAYSMELDEDSAVAMGELYGDLAARSCAYYEDLCGFLGDGTSTYFGFRGIAGAIRAVDATIGNIKSVVVGSGNAYSELTYSDFEKMAGSLPDYADNEDARAFMHKYFYYTVFVRAALAAGSAAQEVILGSAQRQKLMLGYPVEFTQVMPKAEANSQHCCTLGNLRMGCQFGVRGAMEFAQSEHRYFDQGLIAARVRERVAINAHGVGNTTNPGPIIALYTAAS